ncbi:3-dehydroquinate dehydratase [Apibacter raozihei]|uniref:type II 3-dehydroquinate dehydratase n=1 Tax=Apibacter TaxID=1778601 RepID=UPI000FE304E5|nr:MULTISPECIES: type II 3-dehydroquinate dehydratase [Apibacter]
MKVLIINGPNLNLLGKREPEIYGSTTFDEYFMHLKEKFNTLDLEYFQSNHEGFLIDKIHEVGFSYDGIVINPGALTHYSYALHDALKSVTTPAIEIHISDIEKREDFRKISVTRDACILQIKGKGLPGYDEAINYFTNSLNKKS